MTVIRGGNVLGGNDRIVPVNATPVAGTTAVVTIEVTGTPTGGTFRLQKDGVRTAPIAHDANAAAIQSALQALPSIGSGGITVAGTNPFTATYAGNNVRQAQTNITLAENNLTGGTDPSVSITNTTPGVNATGRGSAPGTILTDENGADAYVNTGTRVAPVWSPITVS